MTEYIKNVIVECNRTRSKINVASIPESQDKYKNKWTNNVSTTGIEVDIGDTINLECAAINSKGANEEVIEFIGVNENGVLDNKAELELGFYVNHSGRNTFALPLLNQAAQPNPEGRSTGDLNTFERMLQRDIGGFPQNIDNPNGNSLFANVSPFANLKTGYKITNEGNYYEAGKYYMAKPDGTAGGNAAYSTGDRIIIQVISVKTAAGGDVGIIDEYKFINEGVNIGSFDNTGGPQDLFVAPATYKFEIEVDRAGNILNNPRLTPGSGGSGAPAVVQATLSINAAISSNCFMKNFVPPDNTRYYFLDQSYTGLDFVNWSNTNTIKQLNEKVALRKNKVLLEVPEGYNTPDNVAKLLTDILHEPTQVEPTTDLPFASFNTYSVNTHDYNNYGGITTSLPSIVATPTYQPCPANGNPAANKQNENLETSYEYYNANPPTDLQDAMTRRSYYSSVAYAEPERFEGLQLFRNGFYGANNLDPENYINTGINQTTITSPFGDQELGQLGQRVCSLNNLPTAPNIKNAYCKFDRGKLILTNMLWSEDTIYELAQGFRKCEKYLNGFKKQANYGSDDYKQYAGVHLDFCMYDDMSSYQKDERQNIPGNLNYFGSRSDYDNNTGSGQNEWLVNTQALAPEIDPPAITEKYPCFGQQRDGSPNSGIQLEGLWVQSYWRDEFLVQNVDVPMPPDGADYAQLINELTTQGNYDGNFNLPDPSDANSGVPFLKQNGSTRGTYEELIGMARDANIAAIPIWNTTPGNVFNNAETRPYIAFVSAVNVDSPTANPLIGDNYDFRQGVPSEARWDFNKTIAEQKWFISKWLVQYGFQIGFDNSFTRNKAVIFSNLQHTTELTTENYQNYAGVGMIGAVNPAIKYDPEAGRFEIDGLNSGMTIGNGNLQQPVLELEAEDDPDQLCYNIGTIGNIQPYMNPSGVNQDGSFDPTKYFPCLDMRQLASSIVASQSGVSILNINVYPSFNPNSEDDSLPLQFPNIADEYYKDTLFDKMGFNITQLIPRIGSSQSFFTNNLEFRGTAGTYAEAYQNSLPMTTGQYISSAEIQASSVNSLDMPQYDLGINFFRSARPDVEPAAITAFRIPDKLNYPYLCIYSDIATAGADTTYYGGVDSHSKIPCLAFMTRNYNNGDYFYALESTFNYTATTPFVITDITTDIRLPDGKRPVLDPNSAVIYKIQKTGILPAAVAPSQIKSMSNIKEDERRKDNARRREAIRKTP
jgi:hypothetical protein